MKKAKRPFQARQGDVFVEEVDAVPESAKPVDKKGHDRITLALGEATGHHHSLDIDSADWWKDEDNDAQLVSPSRVVSLEHQEHGPVVLPQKIIRQIIQAEYQPGAIRRTVD